jgi:S1-C subfamily serine protease
MRSCRRTGAAGRAVRRWLAGAGSAAGLVTGLAAGLAACGGSLLHEVPPAPEVPPLTPAQVEAVGSVALAGVLQAAQALEGGYRTGTGCAGPTALSDIGSGGEERTITDAMRDVFASELGDRLGFRVAGDPDDLFGRRAAAADAEFQVGARFRTLRFDLCRRVGLGNIPLGTTGGASGVLAVQVRDQKSERVVYQTEVTAAARLDRAVSGGAESRLRAAVFRDALRRLAADNGFRRALVSGIPDSDALRRADFGGGGGGGPQYGEPAPAVIAMPTAAGGPPTGGALSLAGPPLFDAPLALNVDRIRAATVTVMGMSGHGSGFFLTPDGWLLTNSHVVEGGGDVFRLRLIDGREVWARVERRHPRRDVALLKAVGQGFAALPIRPTLAQVSETTFAIGTPRDRGLGQTVSQGIVSAWRPGVLNGLDAYQATTPIHGGNSGGPLVDAWGNVVGISAAILTDGAPGAGTGLGFFIPIHDALRHLGVRVTNPMPMPTPMPTPAGVVPTGARPWP